MRNFQLPGRSAAYAQSALVATSCPLATLAALDVLRAGGNAADAAVTASAVLCVVEPAMTGIGGDCFVLAGLPDGKVEGLNGSGRASRRADADWLKRSGLTEIAERGIHSVTVPGAIDAWDALLKRHGTMTLGECLAPAIALAEAGVPVTPRVAYDWPDAEALLAADEGGRIHFLKDGRSPRVGEIMAYPALAKTLRLIAREGRDAFYEGAIAEEAVAHLAKRGSLLTKEDFAATRSDWVKPVSTAFAGSEILEIPPNGQGLTALVALNICTALNIGTYDAASPERHHIEIEAMKLAWKVRNRHIADPAFAEVPVAELLSHKTTEKLAAQVDMNHASPISPQMEQSDTIYLSVVDRNRLAISFINSVYDSFGSCIVLPKAGFALQNRGACFVTDPRHPNCIGPGKRPLHTIIPGMARKNGKVTASFGVMGGDYQPMGHMTVMVNHLVYGMDPQEAIDWPRYLPMDGKVTLEQGAPQTVRAGLAARGHDLVPAERPLGGGQAVMIDAASGMLTGGSDGRKDGIALGY